MAEKTLALALLEAQREMKNPGLSGENPHFGNKFVPRDEVLATVKPVLSKYGIVLTQSAERDGMMLRLFGFGESLEFGPYPIPTMSDPQKQASANTYASRIQMMQVFALAGDPDDDGQKASKVEDSALDLADELAAISKTAETNGTKERVAELLGNPKSKAAAFDAYQLMGDVERTKLAAVAKGTVE